MTELELTHAPKPKSTGKVKVKLGILLTYTGMCVRRICRAATALIFLDGHEVISWTHHFFLLPCSLALRHTLPGFCSWWSDLNLSPRSTWVIRSPALVELL